MKYYKPERTVLLHHGDFRPSNILQKTDENGMLKLVLVDHQLVQRGNPVPDLIFFLISGSDEEFRPKHLHQYFDHYYEVFRKALERFGIDADEVYKKEHYDEDVKESLPFGLTVGAFSLPIITVDPSKAAKPEDGIDMESLNMEVSELFPIRFNELVRDYVRM
ncbi:uncharacterized protein [Epargyreus clarus]|uniref:uncharacterized protein n=1 Tax=Epargyreus clarus TaxID=520877 RepID=UPI003C2C3CB4